MNSVIFPDIEPLIVSHLKSRLPAQGFPEVYVATKKAEPGNEQLTQVVVNVSYGRTVEYVIRESSAVIEVYASDYRQANELSAVVAALMQSIIGEQIKMADVILGPVRLADDGPLEKRSLSVDFVIKGTNL